MTASRTSGRAKCVSLDPFANDSRHFLDNFAPEQDLIDIAHVKHIDYSTQIGFSAFPPSEMGVDHEIMLDIDALMLPSLLEFHAVEERFVNAVGYAAAKCRRVIIPFDLPDGQWIDRMRAAPSTRRASVRTGFPCLVTVVSCRGSKTTGKSLP